MIETSDDGKVGGSGGEEVVLAAAVVPGQGRIRGIAWAPVASAKQPTPRQNGTGGAKSLHMEQAIRMSMKAEQLIAAAADQICGSVTTVMAWPEVRWSTWWSQVCKR